ncbi:uncharacterized protein BDW47DRAFT_6428 [Aspergillus candidus]|uniref:Uncharacterized protein n=1 Tax=Aspergillus candidus TaxID=41067 RepID=A0A2I2EXX3_ASPCN|nr:hypothetical protein BDW47DRAFT_6428 [Aspergillus candidus]PLB33222.1 hypothetical protein BDW47DRAFT_6428 [Aspergillus candidus]
MSDPLAPASHCAHAVPFYDLSFHLFVTIVHLLYLFGFCRTRPPHGSNRAVVLSALSVACLCLASHRYPSTILSFFDGRRYIDERSSGPGQSCSTGTELYLSKGVEVELSSLFDHLRPLVIFSFLDLVLFVCHFLYLFAVLF